MLCVCARAHPRMYALAQSALAVYIQDLHPLDIFPWCPSTVGQQETGVPAVACVEAVSRPGHCAA